MLLPANTSISELDDLIENGGGHARDIAWRKDRPLTIKEAKLTASSEDPDELRCASRQLRKQAEVWEALSTALMTGRADSLELHDSAGSGIKEIRTLLEIDAELKSTLGDVGILIQQRQQLEALAVKMGGASAACAKAADELDEVRFERFRIHYAKIVLERMGEKMENVDE